MIKKAILGVMALGLLGTSCSSDDDATATTAALTVNLNGLEALGPNYKYEGWIIVDGAPVSTGTFSSVVFPQTYMVDRVQLSKATKFVLSIEPTNDTDPAPSKTKVLAGDFSGAEAKVNSGIVGDFSAAAGKFFLRTPTDETSTNNGNDENGIWFGNPGMPPTAALTLPTLGAGWKYEGWVIGDAGPISTGTFTAFNTADDTALHSGTQSGPPIPGEDFFKAAPTGETFPLDVRNRKVVISVEPFPDNDSAPFAMKPLTGTAGTTTAPNTHNLAANLGSLPTGTVSR